MNFSFHQIVDPIIKFFTWLFVLISWTVLYNSDLYKAYKNLKEVDMLGLDKLAEMLNTVIPLTDIMFLTCTYWIFSTFFMVISIHMFLKERSLVLSSDILFGMNFTGSFIFGMFMVYDGINLVQSTNMLSEVEKERSLGAVQTTAVFMVFAGFVAILDAGYQVFRRFFQK